MPPAQSLTFTEEEILRLFGNEAAENESLDRLKEYYVKSGVHSRVVTDTPLRLVVGHKGIGKSALVKVAMSEDRERGYVSLLIRPDDILGIAAEAKGLLELIRDWKAGLGELITAKVATELGYSPESLRAPSGWSERLVNFITDSVQTAPDRAVVDPSRRPVIDRFLRTGKIIVYIDDLDRGWEGRPLDIKRISALLNAVRDMSSDNPGLQFRIALRSDVFFLVRTSDESTDKIESSVIWYSWTNHEIFVLLLKRIETFFGRTIDEERLLTAERQSDFSYLLHSVMEPRFTGHGHWENAPMHRVLMSLIRKRPRDLVKLCTGAARQAFAGRANKIGTKHLLAVFQDYSQGRVQDTINEYRTELPDVKRLIMGMKPSKREKTARDAYYFATDELFKKIANIEETGAFTFATGQRADAPELAQFLYKINFLTARKELPSGEIIRYYFEENRYLSGRFADFGYAWEIHPAYRWALQPDTVHDLLYSIRLSADEGPAA